MKEGKGGFDYMKDVFLPVIREERKSVVQHNTFNAVVYKDGVDVYTKEDKGTLDFSGRSLDVDYREGFCWLFESEVDTLHPFGPEDNGR